MIDPKETSPYAARPGDEFIRDFGALLELSVGTREKLGKLPVPWHVAWRLAEKLGAAAPKRPVFSSVSACLASCSRSLTAHR